MIRRVFNTLSLVSAILLACTVFLWAWSFWTNPYKTNLSTSNVFHIGLYDGRVEFFSDKFGPYRGGIIALTSPEWPAERIFSKQWGFGDICGIYYRYFRWADSGAVLWTLSMSLFYPMIVFAVLPAISLWSWRRRMRVFLGALREMFGPRQEMLSVIRLYWWMGVLGVTSLTVAFGIGLAFLPPPGLLSWESLGMMAGYCLHAGILGTSIYVAHRLVTKPEGMLPFARMVGIILATAYFPILTIPGIIGVRRVTKHFAAHCESVANQSAQKPAKGAS